LMISLKQVEKLKILFNVSSFSGYFKQSKDYLQYIVQSFAVSITLISGITQKQQTSVFIGITFFFLYLLTSRASKNSGAVKKYFSESGRALNILLYAGSLIGLIAGLFFHYAWFGISILLFVLIYLIENFRKPIGVAYISEHFSSENLATTLSVESLTKTVYASFLALIIGFFADVFDVGIALSIVSALVLVLGLIFRLKQK